MTDDIVKEKLISGITKGLTESLLADRDAEIAELKQELRKLREGQIIAHSNTTFHAFAMYLWWRLGSGTITFYDGNRCKIWNHELVNHGAEVEIHHKLIWFAYTLKTSEKDFFTQILHLSG